MTLTEEQHEALNALWRREPNAYRSHLDFWYELIFVNNQYCWTCNICNKIIWSSDYLAGSGSKLRDHGVLHIKEHNLLAFI